MKIIGLHWAVHLGYLTVVGAIWLFAAIFQKRAGQMESDIGQVQQLALPVVRHFNEIRYKDIEKYGYVYTAGENISIVQKCSRGMAFVAAFRQRCDGLISQLQTGTCPDQIDWRAELFTDYFRTCDSLAVLCGADSIQRTWPDSCIYFSSLDFSKEQLAGLLVSYDTANAARICRNLSLRTEIALNATLEILRSKMHIWEDRQFDAIIPMISAKNCPRAGVPFEADIYLVSYARSNQNCSVRVDGVPVPVVNGLARYERILDRSGSYPYRVEIDLLNPFTGEVKRYIKEFEAYAAPSPH
jgi:hypothetical protein